MSRDPIKEPSRDKEPSQDLEESSEGEQEIASDQEDPKLHVDQIRSSEP